MMKKDKSQTELPIQILNGTWAAEKVTTIGMFINNDFHLPIAMYGKNIEHIDNN